MREIINVHFPGLSESLLKDALSVFYRLRDMKNVMKKPSTSELLDWIMVLQKENVSLDLSGKEIPLMGVLIKKTEDFDLVRKKLRDGGDIIPSQFSR